MLDDIVVGLRPIATDATAADSTTLISIDIFILFIEATSGYDLIIIQYPC
jgi:hypothetical protein